MHICITRARGCLSDLTQSAQNGEQVILTRRGQAVARIQPIDARSSSETTGEPRGRAVRKRKSALARKGRE